MFAASSDKSPAENGIVVLGYPKNSFWKHMWPSWDYNFIANLPKTFLSVLAINVALIFIIGNLLCRYPRGTIWHQI